MAGPPTDYLSNWPGARSQAEAPAPPTEALTLAIDAFIAALSQSEFDQRVSRTRG
jgi:hypothetical protein